jgi:cullin 3
MSKKPKIKSWKPVAPTTPADEMMKKVESALEIIYGVSGQISYQEIYNCGYSLVNSSKGNELYKLVVDIIYKKTLELCSNEFTDCNFLEKVKELWNKNKSSLIYIKRLMLYVENVYIKERSLESFYDYGLLLFKQLIYEKSKIGPKVKGLLIDEVMKDKHGIVFDKLTVKSVIEMLIEMGLGSNSTYKEIFEDAYFGQCVEFYKEEADRLVDTLNVSEYLKLVEKRITQEKELCYAVIDISSNDQIQKIIDLHFIINHCSQIVGNKNLENLIRKESLEDLKRLYNLFIRSPKCIKYISDSLALYIQVEISSILEDEENQKKPVNTIKILIKTIEYLYQIIENCFKRNEVLEMCVKNSLDSSLNTSYRIAIYFAIYLDNFLKKEIKSMNETQIEFEIIAGMKLLVLLKDKDVFENKYKEFLALRLLEGKSISMEAEKILVKYLKQEYGVQYVSKIEGMINDISSAETQAKDEIFTAKVLTSSFWPNEKFLQINLPDELTGLCNKFALDYYEQHSGRKLIWRYEYGSAQIRYSVALADSVKKYELIGSIYQSCILLIFNKLDTITLDDLLNEIQGSSKEIKKHILGLVKGKVLLKTSKGKALKANDVISLNSKYSSKLIRVQLDVVSGAIEDDKEKLVDTNVEQDRKYSIEASIVKIMKSRRTLEHSLLIAEVVKLSQVRFNPDIKLIKDRIEALIEKEFIRRDPSSSSLYHYIS